MVEKYRKGVGIILLNAENKVFLGERVDCPNAWQFPQGGVDDGEDVVEAAKRELEEETSVKSVEILHITEKWYTYEVPRDVISLNWDKSIIGQQQKWIIMKFTGEEDEININTQNPEFSAWKWGDFASAPNDIVDFKKDLYRKLVEDLLPIINNL